MEGEGFGAIDLLVVSLRSERRWRETNNLLSEDVLQSLVHVNQSMAAIYQALPGRSRMGCDFS